MPTLDNRTVVANMILAEARKKFALAEAHQGDELLAECYTWDGKVIQDLATHVMTGACPDRILELLLDMDTSPREVALACVSPKAWETVGIAVRV